MQTATFTRTARLIHRLTFADGTVMEHVILSEAFEWTFEDGVTRETDALAAVTTPTGGALVAMFGTDPLVLETWEERVTAAAMLLHAEVFEHTAPGTGYAYDPALID